MKIILTGASSFSGMWFAKALNEMGHKVIAPLRGKSYEGLRGERVKLLKNYAEIIYDTPFGTPAFIDLFKNFNVDVLSHHAADVTNYKSSDFDPVSALQNNTLNLKNLLLEIKKSNCHRIVLTGSVFEQREGFGSDDLRAVSPYGLSKGLTSDFFKYYADILDFSLGKFVIPNPFGPYEEFRFTSFLIKNWKEKKCVTVSHPDYVRDNVPISLLAKSYAHFLGNLKNEKGYSQINPSFYSGSQGEFTALFSKEMKKRLNLPCEYTLNKQTDFSEPKVRVNTDKLDPQLLNWNEEKAWNDLAKYYEETTF